MFQDKSYDGRQCNKKRWELQREEGDGDDGRVEGRGEGLDEGR